LLAAFSFGRFVARRDALAPRRSVSE